LDIITTADYEPVVVGCRACVKPQVIFKDKLASEVSYFTLDYESWGHKPDSDGHTITKQYYI